MKTCSLIKTKKNNRYFFDYKLKKAHLCHPLLYAILEMAKQGRDIKGWLESLPRSGNELAGYGPFSRAEAQYYYEKYLLLENGGYFSQQDRERSVEGRLAGRHIKSLLANCRRVILEVTEACDLSCRYCGYGHYYDGLTLGRPKNLDFKTAARFLHFLQKMWNSPLNRGCNLPIELVFAGGEPSLHFSFIKKLVTYAKGLELKYNRFAFSLVGSGVSLPKYMNYLYAHNFKLTVGLDGDRNSNAYRVFADGRPSFDTVMDNLELLRRTYPGYFAKNVTFRALLHKKNTKAGIDKFFKERFAKSADVEVPTAHRVRDCLKEEFWATYPGADCEDLKRCGDYTYMERDAFLDRPDARRVANFLEKNSDFCFDHYNDLFQTTKKNRVPSATCLPFSKEIFLAARGKILPCERLDNKFALGNVEPNGVFLDVEDVAAKYNDRFDKVRLKCAVCRNYRGCTQCVFYLDPKDDTPHCRGYMDEEDFSRHVTSRLNYLEQRPDLYGKILRKARGDR